MRRRRSWREHYVAYNSAPLDAAAAWIEQQREFWGRRLEALDALLQAEDIEKGKTQ